MKNEYAVIIPMVGRGNRFRDAGYDTYKPFINIDHRTMLDGVTSLYGNLSIFIITTKIIFEENYDAFRKLPKNYKLVFIDDHKQGPAYTILKASDQLPTDTPWLITYVDVWWSPKGCFYNEIKDCEAAIFVHRGFHPHLVKDNFSAFCKESIRFPGYLDEIKEKGSFTENWENEPVSIGVFFIKDPLILIKSISYTVESDLRAAGEFYPSVAFNYIKNKCNIKLVDVDAYVHIGVPSQLEDLMHWKRTLSLDSKARINTPIELNCMLIGGTGSRMAGVFETPKHMIPINQQPMYKYVLNKMSAENTVIVGGPGFDESSHFNEGETIYVLQKQTESHLETLKKSLSYIPDDTSVLFSSCDCYGLIDWKKFTNVRKEIDPDCVVFAFNPTLMNSKSKSSHTTLQLENSYVTKLDIKSNRGDCDLGLAGFFWFKSKNVVYQLISNTPNHVSDNAELIVDNLIETASLSQRKPVGLILDNYVHLGTPDEFNEFVYWNTRGKSLLGFEQND